MKAERPPASGRAPAREVAELRARLTEAEAALRAIRSGEVDTLVIAGRQGRQVFTLRGAGDAYRLLIESMNEGALTLGRNQMILYANRRFARMVHRPLKQVMGGSFGRFLSAADRITVRILLRRAPRAGSKLLVELHAGDGSKLPVQISIGPAGPEGGSRATLGLVVTDLTESRRSEERLRELAHRVVQAQEGERGRVALELHDGITQLVCAIVFRSQALLASLAVDDRSARRAARMLCEMAGRTAGEVERISRNLRPGILTQLGLVAALRDAGAEFAERTGVSVSLVCPPPALRLNPTSELTLYRILQEALRNVEKHAGARHVTVILTRPAAFVRLVIRDDGVGFDPERPPAGRRARGGLGLLGMRERATYEGGTLEVRSDRRGGTAVEVRLPAAIRPAGRSARRPAASSTAAAPTQVQPKRSPVDE